MAKSRKSRIPRTPLSDLVFLARTRTKDKVTKKKKSKSILSRLKSGLGSGTVIFQRNKKGKLKRVNKK